EVVGIEMTVAAGPDEHAGVQAALPRQHVREERIGSDVEWDAEKDVGAALIELQVEASARDLRLKEAMARRQGHAADLAGVPGGDDLPPGVRIAFDQLHQIGDLVDVMALRRLPVAPLFSVNGTEIAILVSPLVPDPDVPLFEPADIRVA